MGTIVIHQRNELCSRFEESLVAGQPSQIEDYIQQAEPEGREALLCELLFLLFKHAKSPIDRADLVRRFPSQSELINGLALAELPGSFQSPRLSVGDRIGRYELLEEIGTGEFGCVFKAYDTELKRHVAIKSPKLVATTTGFDIVRFRREGHALAQLQHPNLLTVHDVILTSGHWPLLVLEFLEGDEFDVDEPFSTDWCSDLRLRQLSTFCEALGYAHQKGIVHRDLKPSNLFVAGDGRPVVVDFGLSLQMQIQSEHIGEFAGTVRFMSPEQIRGEAEWLDGRSDIWSIGVILYKLLCGEFPFEEMQWAELGDAIQHDPIRSPRSINPGAPAGLCEICLRCLQKNPEDRFQVMQDLADAINDCRSEHIGRRNRLLVSISVLAALCILAMMWFAMGFRLTRSATQPQQRAVVSVPARADTVEGRMHLDSAIAVYPANVRLDHYRFIAGQPITIRFANASQILPIEKVKKSVEAIEIQAAAINAVRGEAESFQLNLGADLSDTDTVNRVWVSELRSDLHELSKSNIEISLVGFYEIAQQTAHGGQTRWPDVLFPIRSETDFQFNTSQKDHSFTIWTTVYVPENQPPGLYKGFIGIQINKDSQPIECKIPIDLRVHNFLLPPSSVLKKNLLTIDEESLDLAYGFRSEKLQDVYEELMEYPLGLPSSRAMSNFIANHFFPRLVKNKISPSFPCPLESEFYSSEPDYRVDENLSNRGQYKYFDGDDLGECITYRGANKLSHQPDLHRTYTISMRVSPGMESKYIRSLLSLHDGRPCFNLQIDPKSRLKLFLFRDPDVNGRRSPIVEVLEPNFVGDHWRHLAITFDRSKDRVEVFLDAKLVASIENAGMRVAANWLHLGSGHHPEIDVFRGGIDDVRVYPRRFLSEDAELDRNSVDPLPGCEHFLDFESRENSPFPTRSECFNHWCRYWKKHGLGINHLPYKRTLSYRLDASKMEALRAEQQKAYFDSILDSIRANGWQNELSIVLPREASIDEKGVAINRDTAIWFKENIPNDGIRVLTSFGSKNLSAEEGQLLAEYYDNFQGHSDYIDVFCGLQGTTDYVNFGAQRMHFGQFLWQNRVASGKAFSPFIHRVTSVGDFRNELYFSSSAMRLRGFFWSSQMQPQVINNRVKPDADGCVSPAEAYRSLRVDKYRPESFTYGTVNRWNRCWQRNNNDPSNPGTLRLSLHPSGRGYQHSFRAHKLGAGSRVLFYPCFDKASSGESRFAARDRDVLDSIRVQVMRDGIEDYLYWYSLNRLNDGQSSKQLLDLIDDIPLRYHSSTKTIDEDCMTHRSLERTRNRMARWLHNRVVP